MQFYKCIACAFEAKEIASYVRICIIALYIAIIEMQIFANKRYHTGFLTIKTVSVLTMLVHVQAIHTHAYCHFI